MPPGASEGKRADLLVGTFEEHALPLALEPRVGIFEVSAAARGTGDEE